MAATASSTTSTSVGPLMPEGRSGAHTNTSVSSTLIPHTSLVVGSRWALPRCSPGRRQPLRQQRLDGRGRGGDAVDDRDAERGGEGRDEFGESRTPQHHGLRTVRCQGGTGLQDERVERRTGAASIASDRDVDGAHRAAVPESQCGDDAVRHRERARRHRDHGEAVGEQRRGLQRASVMPTTGPAASSRAAGTPVSPKQATT